MIKRYKKRPVIIEAIQFTGHNGTELSDWSESKVFVSPVLEISPDNPTGEYVQVKTLEGTMTGTVGDFIIKGIKGEFYPCKYDIFTETYKEVNVNNE